MTHNDRHRIEYNAIERATERLDDETVVKRIPVERSTSLGEMIGADVYLKMEHLGVDL